MVGDDPFEGTLLPILRELEDHLPPRASRRVRGITLGSWSAADLTTWINQELMLFRRGPNKPPSGGRRPDASKP